MELRTYWKILLRRWWLVLAPVAVVVIYVTVTYAPPAMSYQVVMRFSAGTRPAGLSIDYDRYYPWRTSEHIAQGLADVAETGSFAHAVAERVGESGDQVPAGAIQSAIVTDNARSILVVYLTWPDPAQISAIAGAVAEELTENSGAYYPQLRDLEPAVVLLDDPVPVPLPPGLGAQLAGPVIRISLALFVGIGLAFLCHYLDPTVREAEELADLGWDVLARIPRE